MPHIQLFFLSNYLYASSCTCQYHFYFLEQTNFLVFRSTGNIWQPYHHIQLTNYDFPVLLNFFIFGKIIAISSPIFASVSNTLLFLLIYLLQLFLTRTNNLLFESLIASATSDRIHRKLMIGSTSQQFLNNSRYYIKSLYNQYSNLSQMKNINKHLDRSITQAEILRKIQKSSITSAEQYEMIIQNLQDQNQRLVKDREQLKLKVSAIQKKHEEMVIEQKMQRKGVDPKKYYHRLKRELETSYKELQSYQKKVYNSINKNAINIQLRELVNKFFAVQQEIKEARKQVIDEKKTFNQLQKAIKSQAKNLNKNLPQFQSLQSENKEIKKKISNRRIVDDLTEHLEIRVQDNMIGLKQKGRFFEKLNTLTVQEVKRQQMQSKMEIIKQSQSRASTNRPKRIKTQLFEGKNRYNTQSHHQDFSLLQPKKSTTQIKQQKLFDAREKKSAFQVQLNQLQIKYNELQQKKSELRLIYLKQQQNKQQRERKLQLQKQIQYCEVSQQVNLLYEDLDPLRLESVGKPDANDYIVDDRLLLKDEKQVFITAMMTFENKYGIACVRASYSGGKLTHPYEKIPDKYLKQKCKMRKIILSDQQDYLKWFKIYYHSKNKRVVRIQVFSNNKIRFQAGKSKQELFGDPDIVPFKIDNLASEAPCCLKATYKQLKQNWVLSSLGVQINTLS